MIASYRLTPDDMGKSAALLGCQLLVPHTHRGYRWMWDGSPTVMVVNNSTDTRWFQHLAWQATAMCLIAGRLRWEPKWRNGNLQGQIALYFGPEPEAFTSEFCRYGVSGVRAVV